MELKIERKWNKPNYCIGRFYVNGELVCNTLEDTDRGLSQSMLLTDIVKNKVYGKTAIPTGEYIVSFEVVPAWSTMRNFTVCKKYGYRFPRIKNIKGYDGVYMHSGNGPGDTRGCPLLGRNTVIGGLTDSKACIEQLMEMAKENGYKDAKLIITREF